ncbi:unnamed protein product [Rhizopus stolonifer]
MCVDAFGSIRATLLVNLIVIIGSLLTALAAHFRSFGLMVAARVIFGIGSCLIVAIQQSLLAHWFRHRLAIAFGLEISIGRLFMFLGTLASNPIAKLTGDWVWAFWLSLILCGFSLVVNMVYILCARRIKLAPKKFDIRTLLKFPFILWHVLLIEFLFSASWAAFQTISTDLVEVRFGSSAVLAGYKASTSQIVPIVAAPFLGLLVELYGGRVLMLGVSGVFFIVSMVLLGWTAVNAVAGMVCYSVCLALGLISLITCVGTVTPVDQLGTGYGMYQSANNLGTSILDIVIGVLQDSTANQGYGRVMLLFLILGCVSLGLIVGLGVFQYKAYDNLLETSRPKRLELLKKKYSQEIKGWNWICVGIYLAILVVAWVLFFVYSATGHR